MQLGDCHVQLRQTVMLMKRWWTAAAALNLVELVADKNDFERSPTAVGAKGLETKLLPVVLLRRGLERKECKYPHAGTRFS